MELRRMLCPFIQVIIAGLDPAIHRNKGMV
jgi:hypothetical protein